MDTVEKVNIRERRKKARINSDTQTAIDRISSLPDDIIHHMFFFLDTKYAVQTSVLSKRWKPVWRSSPYLNLDSDEFLTMERFDKFVHSVLDTNHIHPQIINFRCSGKVSTLVINRVAQYAEIHRTEKGRFFCSDGTFTLSTFSSPVLKHLFLKTGLEFKNYKQSPWDLPALTSLHLENLSFKESSYCDLFPKLVSLKDLTLQDCYTSYYYLTSFSIVSPTLENLTISYDDKLETMYNCLCRPISQFVMIAPNLSSFTYKNYILPSLLPTSHVGFLKKVNISLDASPWHRDNIDRLPPPRLKKLISALQASRNVVNHLGKAKNFAMYFSQINVPPMAIISEKSDPHGWLKVVHSDKRVTYHNGSEDLESFLYGGIPRSNLKILEFPDVV